MVDFYIDTRSRTKELASFDFFLDEESSIKSITLRSIEFYNSWWTADFLPDGIAPFLFTVMLNTTTDIIPSNKDEWCRMRFDHGAFGAGETTDILVDLKLCDEYIRSIFHVKTEEDITEYSFPFSKHFSLDEFCNYWNEMLKKGGVIHVNFHCDENNYLVIELTEDREFSLDEFFQYHNVSTRTENQLNFHINKIYKHTVKIINKWFGFKQDKFTKKGKYYSTSPLNFYRTNLFLRSNLVDKQTSLYNNRPSNILCVFPVDDGNLIKHQRYEPKNCIRAVNKTTNHLNFEITDEKGKVVNFRGNPIFIHFSLELNDV